MDATSSSLLIRLQDPDDKRAWPQFVELYTPLIFYWARRSGENADDAADLVQDVFALLIRKLPEFQYDSTKSFRGWLRTITLNKWRERRRRSSIPMVEAGDTELANVPAVFNAEEFWETEYQQQLVVRAIELMESDFPPKTWAACREFIFSGQTAEEVAAKFDISVWTIYSAKSRMLKRLRERLDGMLD